MLILFLNLILHLHLFDVFYFLIYILPYVAKSSEIAHTNHSSYGSTWFYSAKSLRETIVLFRPIIAYLTSLDNDQVGLRVSISGQRDHVNLFQNNKRHNNNE